ncbi:MAG TPA: tail fiber protein [Pseudomonadales bacterium]|nr:tail fiber protein [Pseudomonadales bacterium]
MADPYIGEIRMFSGNYAPNGWAKCDGSLLPIAGNEALFSLIGVTYGGDGRVNFGLPNLQGRLPVGQGQGTGLTPRSLGQVVGTETVTLSADQMPSHNHLFYASTSAASTSAPSNNVLAAATPNTVNLFAAVDPTKKTNTMPADALSSAGATQAHANMMPSLSIAFIIATTGIYPDFP